MRGFPILVFAIVVTVTACGRESEQIAGRETISPQTFAQVFSDLIVARIEAFPDTLAFRERRHEILSRAGVTPEELDRFVEIHGGDEELMALLYRRIRARIDNQFPRGSATPTETTDPDS